MKRILTILLTLFMVLAIAGCNPKQEETVKVEEPTQQEETVKKEEEVTVEKQEETKEEVKEEVKEEKKETTQDITKMKFWVVFYDQDGNELQREALKYGTTPTYWSDTPYYEDGEHWYRFVGWTNKNGKDKPFKPITGNTKYYAKYEIGGEISHSSGGGGSNPPAPPAHVCSKTSTYLIYIVDVPSQFSAIVDIYQWNASSNSYDYLERKSNMDTLKFTPMLVASYIGNYYHANDKDYPGIVQLCDDHLAHTINP